VATSEIPPTVTVRADIWRMAGACAAAAASEAGRAIASRAWPSEERHPEAPGASGRCRPRRPAQAPAEPEAASRRPPIKQADLSPSGAACGTSSRPSASNIPESAARFNLNRSSPMSHRGRPKPPRGPSRLVPPRSGQVRQYRYHKAMTRPKLEKSKAMRLSRSHKAAWATVTSGLSTGLNLATLE
jgi:hypothetical protein